MLLQDKSTTVALVNRACWDKLQHESHIYWAFQPRNVQLQLQCTHMVQWMFNFATFCTHTHTQTETRSNWPALWLAPRWGYTGSGPLHYRWFYPSGSTLCWFYSFWKSAANEREENGVVRLLNVRESCSGKGCEVSAASVFLAAPTDSMKIHVTDWPTARWRRSEQRRLQHRRTQHTVKHINQSIDRSIDQ